MLERRKYHLLTIIRNPLGGIRTYIKYTYGYLDKAKYRFAILTAKEEEGDSQFIKEDLEGFDVRIIEIKGKKVNLLMLCRIIQTLRKTKFSVIHSHGFTAGVLGVLGNIFSRTPHIITSHDIFRSDQFTGPLVHLRMRILAFLLGIADIIQSVGNEAQQNLLEFLPPLRKRINRLKVIKNGIKVEAFDNDIAARRIRKDLRISKDSFVFGFLGRFMPQKGFVYLIDAIEELSSDSMFSESLKILAVNDGDYIREYKRIIHEKNLSKYFIFYGFVPDVRTVMRELDAVIMPSLWEAYSLLPMEALIMGCPVIATNCIGLREVVADTPAIMTRTRDAHSLAMALKHFMADPAPTREKTSQFIPQAKEAFSVKNTANHLDRLFDNVISCRKTYH